MNLQLTEDGRLRHFLTIEGLDRPLLTRILDTAESFEIVAVARPHQFLDRHSFLDDQISDPERSAGTQH